MATIAFDLAESSLLLVCSTSFQIKQVALCIHHVEITLSPIYKGSFLACNDHDGWVQSSAVVMRNFGMLLWLLVA